MAASAAASFDREDRAVIQLGLRGKRQGEALSNRLLFFGSAVWKPPLLEVDKNSAAMSDDTL